MSAPGLWSRQAGGLTCVPVAEMAGRGHGRGVAGREGGRACAGGRGAGVVGAVMALSQGLQQAGPCWCAWAARGCV